MEEIRLQRRQLELDHLELERKNQEAAELLRRTRDEQLEQTSNEIRRIHEQVLHTLSCTSLSLIPSLTFSLLSPYYRLTHCLVRYYDIQELERIALDQTIAADEINKTRRLREEEAEKIAKEKRMEEEVRRRVSQEAQRLQETDDDDGKSTSVVMTMSRRQETRKKRIDDEVARRVEAQKALLFGRHHEAIQKQEADNDGKSEQQ